VLRERSLISKTETLLDRSGAWNWTYGLSRVQILGSLLRHSFLYMRGQDIDDDSGLCHADHILWNAAALCHNIEHNLHDGRRAEGYRIHES